MDNQGKVGTQIGHVPEDGYSHDVFKAVYSIYRDANKNDDYAILSSIEDTTEGAFYLSLMHDDIAHNTDSALVENKHSIIAKNFLHDAVIGAIDNLTLSDLKDVADEETVSAYPKEYESVFFLFGAEKDEDGEWFVADENRDIYQRTTGLMTSMMNDLQQDMESNIPTSQSGHEKSTTNHSGTYQEDIADMKSIEVMRDRERKHKMFALWNIVKDLDDPHRHATLEHES